MTAFTRSGFLRHLAQEAGRFVRAALEEPDPGIPLAALGPEPQMRVVAGRPVYVWLEEGRPVAREGLCPRDGSPVYWRGGPGGAFVCPACGSLEPGELRLRQAAVSGGAVRLI